MVCSTVVRLAYSKCYAEPDGIDDTALFLGKRAVSRADIHHGSFFFFPSLYGLLFCTVQFIERQKIKVADCHHIQPRYD